MKLQQKKNKNLNLIRRDESIIIKSRKPKQILTKSRQGGNDEFNQEEIHRMRSEKKLNQFLVDQIETRIKKLMDFYKSNDKKFDDLKLINIIPKYQTITNSKFIKFDINECFIKKIHNQEQKCTYNQTIVIQYQNNSKIYSIQKVYQRNTQIQYIELLTQNKSNKSSQNPMLKTIIMNKKEYNKYNFITE